MGFLSNPMKSVKNIVTSPGKAFKNAWNTGIKPALPYATPFGWNQALAEMGGVVPQGTGLFGTGFASAPGGGLGQYPMGGVATGLGAGMMMGQTAGGQDTTGLASMLGQQQFGGNLGGGGGNAANTFGEQVGQQQQRQPYFLGSGGLGRLP